MSGKECTKEDIVGMMRLILLGESVISTGIGAMTYFMNPENIKNLVVSELFIVYAVVLLIMASRIGRKMKRSD